ncbi:MAG: Bax inhibitor-1/YccA family protein [Alphaproteobacteria bacterium]|nr:Bax inhibitor-1/YccA family protein [Alphaproteobacteria bacterium]
MVTKKSKITDTTARRISRSAPQTTGIDGYLKRIFALMFGAVALTGVAAFLMLATGAFVHLFNASFTGFSATYYVLLFGGLALSIWAQVRVFHMKPSSAAWLLALYAILIGVTMTPLLAVSLSINPASILWAFGVAALMFACMAMFGYKTVKDLSFLGIFLFIGMIGLILVGVISIFVPLGTGFSTVVSLIGVLVFALFTAYDMQNLKNAYNYISDDTQKNQMAVLGALHLYISFIAMFEYLLSLFNRE